MTVGPAALSVDLPSDVPSGAATIRAVVRDDVLNQATRTLALVIVGTGEVAPVTPLSGGAPRHARGPEPRTLRHASTAHTNTRWQTSTVVVSRVRSGTRATWSLPTGPVAVTVTRARTRAGYSTGGAAVPTLTTSQARSAGYAVTRTDGPDESAALILLGIL